MASLVNRLSDRKVASISKTGRYADGGNLYLQVSAFGTKSWLFRFSLAGKARQMGIGPLHTISLAEARVKAREYRQLLLDGVDPIEHRKRDRAQQRLENVSAPTFRECSEQYIASHEAGWQNEKHAQQWRNTLMTYADPVFGDLPVNAVDTALVMKVIEPVWKTKTETASRLRGRIERILDWAKTREYRSGENPARWKGHLDILLPRRSTLGNVTHHAALPYVDMPEFMTELRGNSSIAARGLEFLTLTAARTGEVIGATWSEIDMDNAVWTIPAGRMKVGQEHRVPLSEAALKVLEEMQEIRLSEYVFPGARQGRPLSNMAFLQLLKRMQRRDVTAHGFRSTFRDWGAECTANPRDVLEMALAHTLPNKVEAAYLRSDLFDKRRGLMGEWAKFCDQQSMDVDEEKVVPLQRRRET